MLGATIMVLGIVTSITALQYGMRSVDTARNMTLAAQIMQSEVEILRLQNWSQISALPASTTVDPSTMITTGTSTPLDATLTNIAARFTCVREVSDFKTNMKLITLTVSWTALDGRPRALKFQTRYAKNGLSDYFYVAH
jgi:Na+-transporting NADH:ubiquinone oxidoreductase subunit NqrC